MRSRSGEAMGFGIRVQPGSRDLFVYLQGGGACFDPSTCLVAARSYGERDFAESLATVLDVGCFADVEANPFRAWNQVFVPYATGDLHGGTVTDLDVEWAPTGQRMGGALNIDALLEVLAPFATDRLGVDRVVLAGMSAGGLGSLLAYPAVAEAFRGTPVTLIDDSGPLPLDDSIYTPCLRERWEAGYDLRFPADLDDVVDRGDRTRFQAMYEYLSVRYPDARLRLVVRRHDEVLRQFFGLGQHGCEGERAPLDEDALATAVDGVAAHLDGLPNWEHHVVDGTFHGLLVLIDHDPELRAFVADTLR